MDRQSDIYQDVLGKIQEVDDFYAINLHDDAEDEMVLRILDVVGDALLKAKNDALEEAARVSEAGTGWIGRFHRTNEQPSALIAQAIRNLKHEG